METVTESMGFSPPLHELCTESIKCVLTEGNLGLSYSFSRMQAQWLLCEAKGNSLCWVRAERACVHSSLHNCGVGSLASVVQSLPVKELFPKRRV